MCFVRRTDACACHRLASVVSSDKGSVASSFSADDLRELFTLRADCVSDTLDSFKDGKEDEEMAEDSDGAAAKGATTCPLPSRMKIRE